MLCRRSRDEVDRCIPLKNKQTNKLKQTENKGKKETAGNIRYKLLDGKTNG